jgi:CRISPR system Cascade subunit CasD
MLRLAAPLQSWGTSSRFVRRNTDRVPSKSGVVGLLAAARGLRRTDPLEDLLNLRIGVRVEQPGQIQRDFQTAHTLDGRSMPLSYRFYLSDAVFLVALQGEPGLLEGLRENLARPVFPLYLGRRSYPPAARLDQGLRDGGIPDALENEPWQASAAVRARRRSTPEVDLDAVLDADPGATGSELVRDQPLPHSFDPIHRDYGWRTVRHQRIAARNPDYHPRPRLDRHNPMLAFGEA